MITFLGDVDTPSYGDIRKALNLMLADHNTIPLAGDTVYKVLAGKAIAVKSIALPDKKIDPEGTMVCIILDNNDMLLASLCAVENLTRHVLRNKMLWYWGDVEFSLVSGAD